MRVTPTYNLAACRPELAGEWHPKNERGPESYTPFSNTKVWWRCSKGHEWQALISGRANGKGCSVCAGLATLPNMSIVATHPDLMSEWSPRNTISPHSVVAGSARRLWWRCAKGHEWESQVRYRAMGRGCPCCAGRAASPGQNSLAARFPELAAQWHERNDRSPDDLLPGSGYYAWWKCDKGHEWQARLVERTKDGQGCARCSGRVATLERNLATEYPNLALEWSDKNERPPSEYTSGSSQIMWWRCVRGHEWKTTINSRTTGGTGCEACIGKIATPERNFATEHPELVKYWHPRNQDPPTAYTPRSHKKVWWVCDAGHEWEAVVGSRADGRGCARCSNRQSQPERDLTEILTSWGFGVEQNVRGVLANPRLELDLYLPDRQLAIEYNGLVWHGERYASSKRKHVEKLDQCTASGIRLITIFESEWLARRAAVEGYLKAILGVARRSLGARKLDRRPVLRSQAAAFLDAHHIQGACAASQWVQGLYAGGELVAVMCCRYGKGRGKGETERRWELVRYCVAADTQIVGGFQRLWQAFLREVRPTCVVSFSDRRWSVGDLYRRAGFSHEGCTPISYWYFKENDQYNLYHKSLFMKSNIAKTLGILPNETEYQAMLRHGYDRIWDCGLDRWVWHAS